MSPKTDSIYAVCHFNSSADAQKAISELNQIGVASSAVQTIGEDGISGRSTDQVRQQFISAGVHEEDVEYLNNELQDRGGVLAVVRTDSKHEKQVDEVFSRYGAHEVDEYSNRGSVPNGAVKTTATGDQKLEVVEEQLIVGKRNVSRGGARIYSRVIETPVEETVSLSEEKVRVSRRKVDRAVDPSTIDAFDRERTIEVQTTGEEVVTGKKARVVEEVTIGKDTTARQETVRDTVRRTDIQVEEIPADVHQHFEEHYESNYGDKGEAYDSYAPAYQYGYQKANDPQYTGRSYDEVESDLRSDYETKGGAGAWDKFKDAIQSGWNKVSGN